MRVSAVAIGLVAVGWSASRTALVALIVALIVILGHLVPRRRLVAVGVATLIVAMALVPAVPRFRQTAEIVTRSEFASEVASAFETGTTSNARRLSDSGVEANILIRFSLWGAEFDEVLRSPLLGLGRFRGDDLDTERSGIDGLFLFAVDGERRHSHAEPHNMYLYLLGETGLIGLVLFSTPYVWVILRTRKRRSPVHEGWEDEPVAAGAHGSLDERDASNHSIEREPENVTTLAQTLPHVRAGWSYWTGERLDGLPDPMSWRALVRGMLAFGLVAAIVSVGLLATGLGLIVNLTVFAAAIPFCRPADHVLPSGVATGP